MAHDLLNIWLRFDDGVDLNVATLLNIFQNDWDDIMFGSGLANKDGRLIYFESIWAAKLLRKVEVRNKRHATNSLNTYIGD